MRTSHFERLVRVDLHGLQDEAAIVIGPLGGGFRKHSLTQRDAYIGNAERVGTLLSQRLGSEDGLPGGRCAGSGLHGINRNTLAAQELQIVRPLGAGTLIRLINRM